MSRLFKKILCPVDFDENSMAALDTAAELARENGATLCVMHVVFTPLGAPGFPLEPHSVVSEQPSALELEEVARNRLGRKIKHEVIIKIGKPAEAIIQAAEDLDVDLIVMATHGRSGVARLFLGSVAEHVVRGAQRPVLSVRPQESAGHGAPHGGA
jgi:universal stress protein A